MQQLLAVWQALDPRKRIIVAAATLAMFFAVYALIGAASRPSMALLYSGLDGARAGEILAALDQRAVAYDVRGDAIYVDSRRRDQLRMELAGEGLPSNSGQGYELLDSLSGFGTTSQMFDAAYWRAKEGELARTIATLPNMRSVRVHISNTEPRGFRAPAAPKASVTVTTRDGGLSARHARALRFLVAAAVAGMVPDDVAIIDSNGGLIQPTDSGDDAGNDRAAALRDSVTRILEARVGPGKAIVEVAVETITESEAITERTIDPQGRVAISSETEENSSSSNDTGGSAVTVASNLPSGDAAGPGKQSQSTDSETRERVNYEVSETRRELVKAPGAIRRLTVAVLVDGVTAANASGAPEWQPRSDEEMTALRDLVAAAVGFDETRGDVITIRSLAFEPLPAAGTTAGGSLFDKIPFDVMGLIQLAVLAVVTLILGLFVLRPILTSRTPRAPALPAPAARAPSPGALTGTIEDGEFAARDMTLVGDRTPGSATSLAEAADPVTRLRHLISERQDETAEILKSWMNDPVEEKA